MANCGHPGATCAIGTIWTCSSPGCPNEGHASQVARAARARSNTPVYVPAGAVEGWVSADALGDLQPGVLVLPNGPRMVWTAHATDPDKIAGSAPGYVFRWKSPVGTLNNKIVWHDVVGTYPGPQTHGCALYWRKAKQDDFF